MNCGGRNMKHIILVKDMQCAHCAKRIDQALNDAGIKHEVNLENKSVSVEKNGDIVSTAKRIITDAGYTVL